MQSNYTNKCLICGEIANSRHFYSKHKIKERDYYIKYYGKKDLFTEDLIQFKNIEQYFLTDFNDKRSLKKYIDQKPRNEVFAYLSDFLTKRVTFKKHLYSPGQLEAKTLTFPSINYIEKKFGEGSYAEIVSKSKAFLRFNYSAKPRYNDCKIEIIVDTREQEPLDFNKFIVKKLNYGDYCGNPNNNVFIERKSINDLLGTLSGGYERFLNELNRCKLDDAYMVILVEEPLDRLISFNYQKHIFSKADPSFIFHRIREINQEFPRHCQFLCVENRQEAVSIVQKLLRIKNIAELDLQYLYTKCLI
jgi:hypothetical protein